MRCVRLREIVLGAGRSNPATPPEFASFEGHSVAHLNASPNFCCLSSSRSVNHRRRARSVSAMRERERELEASHISAR